MKTVLTVIVFLYSFACIADPVMRTSHKRAPLRGKVKIVRKSGGSLEHGAKWAAFNRNYYSVDSFSRTGLILCRYWIARGSFTDQTIYEYDGKGNMVKECIGSRTEQGPCTRYTYDSSGRLAEEITSFSWGNTRTIKYIYVNGRLAAKKQDNDELTTFAYNDKGQVVKKTVDRPNLAQITTKYTYYDNGNMQSETTSYGIASYKTVYTYDEYDNEILAEEHINDGPVTRSFASEYVYDSKGNWIRCTTDFPSDFGEGHEKQSTVREIEYY